VKPRAAGRLPTHGPTVLAHRIDREEDEEAAAHDLHHAQEGVGRLQGREPRCQEQQHDAEGSVRARHRAEAASHPAARRLGEQEQLHGSGRGPECDAEAEGRGRVGDVEHR